MASVTVNAVDTFVPRIVAAFNYYYPKEMANVAAGVGIKTVLTEFITAIVANYEAAQAGQSFQQTIQQKYDDQHAQTVTDCGANLS